MTLSTAALVFWTLLALTIFAVVSRIARKPYPIVMLIGGALLALIPGMHPIVFPPDLVFLVMLPLLLFGGGWSTDFRQFKYFIAPILWLALGLVVVTTVTVALVAHAWLGLPLASAFVLGAILSPSDAIATEAIAEEIEFPQGSEAILSGESLVNDAAALVIYGFAIEAVVRGTFSPVLAVADLFYVSIAGVAIGLGVCYAMYRVQLLMLKAKLSDETLGVLVSLITPFMAYLPAQAAQASGVLAAVSGGVFLSTKSSQIFTPDIRIAAAGVWGFVVFALNGLAFILIGLQLPSVFAQLNMYDWKTLAAYALGMAAIVIVTRFALVMVGGYARYRIRKARGSDAGDTPLWGDFFITSWSGMRGIVTLAAALAVPTVTASGAPFPGRALILYLAFTTILITLIGQGLTLPAIVKRFGSTDDSTFEQEVGQATLRLSQAARERLRELEGGFTSTQEWEAASRLIAQLDERIRESEHRIGGEGQTPHSDDDAEHTDRKLRAEMLQAERQTLEVMRRAGEISDRAYRHVQYNIDLIESFVKAV